MMSPGRSCRRSSFAVCTLVSLRCGKFARFLLDTRDERVERFLEAGESVNEKLVSRLHVAYTGAVVPCLVTTAEEEKGLSPRLHFLQHLHRLPDCGVCHPNGAELYRARHFLS